MDGIIFMFIDLIEREVFIVSLTISINWIKWEKYKI